MENVEIPGLWFPRIYEQTKNAPRIEKVEVLSDLSQAEFSERFAKQSIPFILREKLGIMSEEEALDLLMGSLGLQIVSVRFGDMSEPEIYIKRTTKDMALREFLSDHFMTSSSPEIAYAGSSTVTTDFVEQLGVRIPRFYPNSFFVEPRLWLGRAGTVTPLHKDIPDNFAFSYFGSKKWVIYPPRDFPNLYMVNPHEAEYPDFGASLINLRRPNIREYPAFADARALEFTLLAGDLLYLPAGWSHYVDNHTDSLMLNFWLRRDKSPAVLGCDC